MALDKNKLKRDLLSAFKLGEEINPEANEILNNQVDAIAKAIDDYIRSGTVETTVSVNIPVSAVAVGAGVAAAPNPVPIPLEGSGDGKIK